MNSLRSLGDVLADADALLGRGESAGARVWATGFPLLDKYLGGGIRSGDLTLFGGPQGAGKTTFALQMLRNIVAGGDSALYFSFEHDASSILERLIAIEAAEHSGMEAPPLRRIREAMDAGEGRIETLEHRLAGTAGGVEAVRTIAGYADRLFLHRSSGSTTDLGEIRAVIDAAAERSGSDPFVVVDYLQKVAVPGGSDLEEERVTVVTEGLKDISLERQVPVLAVAAAEKEGLVGGRRLRVHNLRGGSALAYEPDIVLILNEKYDVVARHHLVYNSTGAERFRSWSVVSIEKNRSGLDKIDIEFRKRFEQGRFETEGQPVSEQLVDERVFVE